MASAPSPSPTASSYSPPISLPPTPPPPPLPPLISAFRSDADVRLVDYAESAREASKRLSGASFSAVETDLTGSALGISTAEDELRAILVDGVGCGRFGAVRSR